MDKKFFSYIKIEHIFLMFIFVFTYLIWSNIQKMKTDFNEIEKQWDSLDVEIKTYQVKIQQMDSISKSISNDIASFDEYR